MEMVINGLQQGITVEGRFQQSLLKCRCVDAEESTLF